MLADRIPEKWRAGIAALKEAQKCESVAFLGDNEPADLILWFPEDWPLDIRSREFTPNLDALRAHAGKAFFAVLPYVTREHILTWEEELKKRFRLLEWFVLPEFIIANGVPWVLHVQGPVKGALDQETRIEHVRQSTARVKARVEKVPSHQGKCTVVCYGPSLHGTWENIIGERQYGGNTIVSVSGAHDFLIRRGIVPDYHVEFDPRAERALFTDQPHERVRYLLASCCHPALFDRLDGSDVTLWHAYNGDDTPGMIQADPDCADNLIVGGSCIGLRTLSLFFTMGFREFSIHGMDCSFSDRGDQWAGVHPGQLKKIKPYRVGDRTFQSNPVLALYASEFFTTAGLLRGLDPTCEFYLQGDGLLQEKLRLHLEKEGML